MDRLAHTDETQWDTDKLVAEYRFIEKRTGEFAPPAIFISFVELGRFEKRERECRSTRDRLFYWFNNSYMAEENPSCASEDPEMSSLVEATRIAAFTPGKKDIYTRDIMTELDIQYAKKREFKAGLAEGQEKGKEEVAKSMKQEGLPTELICRVTGLDAETVETIFIRN